ncbi:hypothetical protein [Hymenobacter glacieicola]|uniref:Uncharacterized protein n=1 Tax=Hymenobacter glacieicola TaxID=1562124 RepID=A0ABQ1X5C6_9BACT|nr:hypothetical protein [Hymenobacter glacieicola]GGG60711.1 hypothetical protein GCM10011378_40920 [Hymenobacter glacieicola]
MPTKIIDKLTDAVGRVHDFLFDVRFSPHSPGGVVSTPTPTGRAVITALNIVAYFVFCYFAAFFAQAVTGVKIDFNDINRILLTIFFIKKAAKIILQPTNPMRQLIVLLFSVAVAMIGYTIHGSIFWSIVDFIFSPIALIKWLICHELTLTVLHQTFDFLLK